jgi:hypothetical protein
MTIDARYFRPATRCLNRKCRQRFDAHVGDVRECPSLPGRRFSYKPRKPTGRATNSFKPQEVTFLHELVRMVARGGDTRMLGQMHARELGSLAAKVATMRKRLEAQRSAVPAPSRDSQSNGAGTAGTTGAA